VLPVTIHKLIGLVLGIYLEWTIYQTYKVIPLNPTQIILVGITDIFFCCQCCLKQFVEHEQIHAGSGLDGKQVITEATMVVEKVE